MVLDTEQEIAATSGKDPRARNAIRNKDSRWPGGVVPYVLANNQFSSYDKSVISKAMRIYKENTCIRYVGSS